MVDADGKPLTYFNPRSPRGGATLQEAAEGSGILISIHAPHEGERQPIVALFTPLYTFQSTLPTRGSDAVRCWLCERSKNFNPRSPRGGATWIAILP